MGQRDYKLRAQGGCRGKLNSDYESGISKKRRKMKTERVIHTPVFRAEVSLRADSTTVNNYAENDEAYKTHHFDQAENEFD